ncbi:aldo/keto reductase [candidate division KSB1 bacterium]|nr:aldo/keto reductase [candidate division KSB1 bacterium]
MNLKLLGSTGLRVTQLGLGGLFVSSFGGPFEQGKAAIKRAVALGINYIDTAPGYANSEEVLGRVLEEIDAPLIISTKLGGRPQPFEPQNRDALMRSVEESLRLLKRDTIDMLMIHEPDRPRQYDWWTDWETVNGPVLELIRQLKRDGTIKATGLGGTTAYELAHIIRSGKFDVVLTAFNYSLLWREAEIEVLPAAKKLGMGIIAGSPLQQGALARRYDQQVNNGALWLSSPRRKQFKALYGFLDEINMPIVEASIRFVISNPAIDCVLMGARSAEEVEGNVAAIEKGPLPTDVLKRLEEIAALVPFRPFEEPFGLPFNSDYKGPGWA